MIDQKDIFNISSTDEFEASALQLFEYQFEHNSVYRSYCDLLYKHPSEIHAVKDIPFLPIQFFKTHDVMCGNFTAEKIFESSGTTNHIRSKHYVKDLSVYRNSFQLGFQQVYGDAKEYVILGLLPSYLERSNSSLIFMVNALIEESNQPESGFFLNNQNDLYKTLLALESQNRKTILIGVSFALLDFVSSFKLNLKNTFVMETGGMKGRRKELIREDLHTQLRAGFGVSKIHSEYGMTELLTQAYSKGNGLFETPNWMKIIIRNPEDPFSILPPGKTGGINIVDLANLNSCAFIETQDLGRLNQDHTFEVLGRFDHSEIRGCNLMAI